MSVFSYKRFKVLLNADSKKVQGLRTGDIVRRQYFDGTNVIYSLMAVLDYGKDETTQQPYFIGALLEGDEPETGQILDFVRITSLMDTDRSGALYLTASDSMSPYMDVIDGIGRNFSFCWPVNIGNTASVDPTTQYVVKGSTLVTEEYIDSMDDCRRILHLTRNSTSSSDPIGIEQQFYKFVSNPQRILVSYRIKGSSSFTAHASLMYINGTNTDGSVDVDVTTEWQYKFHAITVDYSGRHLRKFLLTIDSLAEDDEVWISDLNIILQSSLTSFNEASKVRVGRLDGVSDEVFGRLDGYGSYLQKLYASGSAHISGTLTAGDENGFGATFYAGKIHRNVLINSLDCNWTNAITINTTTANPTGVGKVYDLNMSKTLIVQSREWLNTKIGKKYTFSFWGFPKKAVQIAVQQNGFAVGVINIPYADVHGWHRYHLTFDLLEPSGASETLQLTFIPTFSTQSVDTITGESSSVVDIDSILFSAPQLESGKEVTQYQPTDATLNYTEDYGAWFSRGGIGGTIQNPLLKLNYDGNGGIKARNNAFVLNNDGSGHLAKAQISWDEEGNVTFGGKVTLTWDNLDDDVQDNLYNKSIRILGGDTFTLVGDLSGSTVFSPESIELTISETNMQSTSSQRAWYYLSGNTWVQIQGENGLTLEVEPDDDIWMNKNIVTVKAQVTIDDHVYADTITLRKEFLVGYSVEIVSSMGDTFMNGECSTVLTANVYYQGLLVDPEYVAENFTFFWRKYKITDELVEEDDWWQTIYDEENNVVQEFIDRTQQAITLNCPIDGSDMYTCELQIGSGFAFSFPAVL